VNSLLAALFVSAFVFIQCYISGTRLAFSLPAYTLIALASVLSFFAWRDLRAKPSRWCLAVSAVFFAYILTRATLSPVEYLSRADFYMVIACLMVYGLTAIYITDRTLRMGILWVMFGLAAVEVIIGTRQFAFGDNWMPFGLVRSTGNSRTRASGMFISSIHLAGYLEAIGPFALALAFWGACKLWARLLAGYVAVVCYFGVAITGSRGGWLSTCFSLFIFLIFSLDLVRKTNRARFPLALYLSLVGLLIVPAGLLFAMQRNPMLNERLGLLTNISEPSKGPYDVRVYNWMAALDQWRESRWIGTGAGTHLYFGRLHRREPLQADPEHAHSDYLELLAEYGLAGAAGMLAFLAVHAAAGWSGYRRLRNLRAEDPYRPSHELAFNVGALTAVSAYLAHSAVDFNLHLPGNALLLAFIFGLLANPAPPPAEADESSAAADRPRWWARLPLPALGAWMLISGTPKLPGEALCEKSRRAQAEGNYDDAIKFAHQALDREKGNPYLYYHLGQAHRLRVAKAPKIARRPDLLEAERAYRAAIALFPQDEDSWVRLGQTLDGLTEYAEARKAYEKAIQLDPKLGVLYAYLAEHFKKIGDTGMEEATRAEGQRLSNFNLSTYFSGELRAPDAPEEQPK
jgi:O-antigen ligase